MTGLPCGREQCPSRREAQLIGSETALRGLEALFIAAACLVEDAHSDLLDARDTSLAAYTKRSATLSNLTGNLAALAAAADVLISNATAP